MIMFELDAGRKSNATITDFEAAKISHDYLVKLGYKF
jgi:inosose dehydratase